MCIYTYVDMHLIYSTFEDHFFFFFLSQSNWTSSNKLRIFYLLHSIKIKVSDSFQKCHHPNQSILFSPLVNVVSCTCVLDCVAMTVTAAREVDTAMPKNEEQATLRNRLVANSCSNMGVSRRSHVDTCTLGIQ